MIAKGSPLMISPAAVTSASAASAYRAAINDGSETLGSAVQLVTYGPSSSDEWLRVQIEVWRWEDNEASVTAYRMGTPSSPIYFDVTNNAVVTVPASAKPEQVTDQYAFMLVLFSSDEVKGLGSVGTFNLIGYADPRLFANTAGYQGLRTSSWASIDPAGNLTIVTYGV